MRRFSFLQSSIGRRRVCSFSLCIVAWALYECAYARADALRIRVTTDVRAESVPLSATIPAPPHGYTVVLERWPDGFGVPCQYESVGTNRIRLHWIARRVAPDRAVVYLARFAKRRSPEVARVVVADDRKGCVEVKIDGHLFTRYHYGPNVPKPFCHPLTDSTGRVVTRGFPLAPAPPGGTRDHRHHRGFWFALGDVNGVDFWTDPRPRGRKPHGRIVHRKFLALTSGPVFGEIASSNVWVRADNGTKICEDERRLRVYATERLRVFDFSIVLKATEGPLVLGDTKEGALAIRVADSMRVDAGRGGMILNANGARAVKRGDDRFTWGKRASWCDYSGPVGDAVVGILFLDHPHNLRHPTYWMVRTYGLFASNRFGVRAFTRDPRRSGRYVVPAGKRLELHYRIVIHPSRPTPEWCNAQLRLFASPPKVTYERSASQ